ncbi:unnamed protein product [Hermetia illucens]|uniref:Odorant receptor n=1 Tax=Hermetia illucens TaxID=343691 RepID=A0A7R8UTY8_HERIL|nr:unnamed protein product [Hermetia illucens]
MSPKNPKLLFHLKNPPENKIDSIQAFGVVYFTLKFQGMVIPGDYRLRHKICAAINFILINICYYFSFIIQLFYVDNLKELLENVPMNLSVTACTIKFFVILRLRPSLIEINKKLERLDSRPMTDKQKDQLRRVINFCRLISLSATVFYMVGNLTYTLAAALSHGTKLAFASWFPYDWGKNAFRFWGTLFIQTMLQQQVALEDAANDFLAVLYLILLSAHLQIIMERFANIHYDPEKTEEESFQEFIECLEDHRIIME